MTFQLYSTSGGKKSRFAVFVSSGGAAFFHGRSGIVFSKAFVLANALCDQNWDELFSLQRPDPAVACNGNETPVTWRCSGILTKPFCALQVAQKRRGGVRTLLFPVLKRRGEVQGVSVKPLAESSVKNG